MNVIANDKKINLRRLLTIALWCGYFFFLILNARDWYQTFKDMHYHMACICLVLLAMLIKKDFKFNPYALIPAGGYLLGCINYLYDSRAGYGWEYRMVLVTRFCLFAIGIVWLLSVFSQQRITEFNWKKYFGSIFTVIVASLAAIIDYSYALYFIVPFILILTVGKLDMKDIKEQYNLMAVSLYIDFFVSITASLIIHPENDSDGRYTGLFLFPIVIALLCMMGIFAVAFFFSETFEQGNRLSLKEKKRNAIVLSAMAIYPLIVFVRSQNRAVLLGAGVIIVVIIIYLLRKCSKPVKITAAAAAGVLVAGAVFALVWMTNNFDLDAFMKAHNIDSGSLGYYLIVHLPCIREYNNSGVFDPGSVLAAIDSMSSDRLAIWVTGLKKVTLFGKNDLTIILPTGENAGHVHSSYVHWLLNYGAIVGGLLLVWMGYNFISTVRIFFKDRNKIFIPALFVMLSLGVFLVEKETFQEFLPMLMLVFSYRYFYDLE